MTGPEHYLEAERLLAEAAAIPSQYDESNPAAELLLKAAKVHALLAGVAVEVARLADRYVGDGPHINEWRGLGLRNPIAQEADAS